MTFAEKAYRYYSRIRFREPLPRGVSVMNPYRERDVRALLKAFLGKYFSDARERTLVLGINPGRFGAGITGIAFTDPVALEMSCGIPNGLPKKREQSSIFVYELIERWGGPKAFYRDFFITSACPLGFLKDGKNYNFYDERALLAAARPFIVGSLKRHLAFGCRRDRVILFGKGQLQKAFREINDEHGFFREICALDHPRVIVQYHRKDMAKYLRDYENTFRAAMN